MRRGALFLLLALAAAAPALAQPRFATFTLENDSLAGQDRHYTGGLQLALPVDNWLAIGPDPHFTFAVGQRLYTPDVKPAFVEPGDRPFAGWLYAMADIRLQDGPVVDYLTLSVGIIGPSARGREAQDAMHNLYNKPRVTGWRDQLRDEVALLAGFERTWPAVASGTWQGRGYDLGLRAGATLGNVITAASAGAVVRYGTQLPRDLPVTHISLGPARDGFRGAAAQGWYAWAGLDARAVDRNIFLDGNTHKDGVRVDRRPLGFDAQLGVAFVWPDARASLALVRRSEEFEGQKGADRYVQVSVSLPLP